MIKTTNVYLDKTGGFRLYISMEIENILKWANHQQVILSVHDGKLIIVPSISKTEAPAWYSKKPG